MLVLNSITITILIKYHIVYGIWPMLIYEVSYLVYLSFLLHWFDLLIIQAFFLVLVNFPGVPNGVQISNSHLPRSSSLTVTRIVATRVQRCFCLGFTCPERRSEVIMCGKMILYLHYLFSSLLYLGRDS